MLSVLLFLLGFFLPTQLGKHFWPSFSIVDGLRVDFLSPTIYFTDILACLIIIFYCSSLSRTNFSTLFVRSKTIIFIAILFLLLSLGIYFSKSPLAGWYSLIKLTEFILLGFALKHYFQQRKLFTMFLYGLFVAVLFESALAVWQFILQGSVGGLFYFFGERTFTAETPGIANASLNGALVLRPYGTLPHPNVLAGFLVVAMVLLFDKKMFGNNKWALLSFYFLGTGVLLLTLSRVAILLWFVFLGLKLFGLVKKKSLFVRFNMYVIPIAILLLLFFITPLHYRFLLSLQDESISERLYLLGSAWNMIIRYPILGVGFGNFLFNNSNFSRMTTQIFTPQPTHNIFFLVAAETGIFNLLIFFWFIGTSWLKARKNMGLSFLVFFFFCIGMVDHYFITLQQGQLLTVLIFSLCWSFQYAN